MKPLAIAVERSDNKKIGNASATYVTQATCPKTCPFLNAGCYAETGFVGLHARRLEEHADPASAALEESAAIDRLSGKRDLRMHVVGDVTSNDGAKNLAGAAARYLNRAQSLPVRVWTYTHAWRSLRRKSFGPISVLASCETTQDVKKARKKGYATAIVVDKFKSDKAWTEDGIKIVPCPEMTRGIVCTDCRLCLNDNNLKKAGITIAFEAHGSNAEKVRQTVGQKSASFRETPVPTALQLRQYHQLPRRRATPTTRTDSQRTHRMRLR